MTYNDANKFVKRSYARGHKAGFDVCGKILEKLGNPHKKLKIVHVAGTNGKGSTCVFTQRILMEAGYSVGMFTSPHLCCFNERFNINGRSVGNDEFAGLVESVDAAFYAAFGSKLYDKERNSGFPSISYFELLTIMAFLYFYKKNVDIAIMEVGIGGRLDATNIIETSVLSIITSISLDHTQYLGDTVEKIAAEKGGIIKKNSPVVLYFQGSSVYNVIKGMCQEKNAPLFYPSELDIRVLRDSIDGAVFNTQFTIGDRCLTYDNIRLGMFGGYQIYNAANMLLVAHALNTLGYDINDENVRLGMLAASWPGRMEVVSRSPLIVLEGAHNIQGAEAARLTLKTSFAGKKIILVTGVLKEKDYHSIVNILSEEADYVIFTQPTYNIRAVPANKLHAALSDQNKRTYVVPDYKEAMEQAVYIASNDTDSVVFVSGSLYLVGDVKKYLDAAR